MRLEIQFTQSYTLS